MGLPKVSISNLNGQLGQVAPSADGVAGFVFTGVAVVGEIALGESKKLTSLQDLVDLGIDADYDTDNDTNVYKTISDFYKNGDGPECWIMIVVNTTTMATMCDIDNNILKKLINDSGRTIRLVGITRVPDEDYEPVYANQLDPDILAAAVKAEALALAFEAEMAPVRIIIDGRDFQGTVGTLVSIKTQELPHVRICLWTDVSGSDNAAIGLEIGRLATIPVQRNMGRVKDGDLGIDDAFLTGQTTSISALTQVQQDGIYDKGYGTVRKYPAKDGWFISDDLTATLDTDDYNHLARGRVIDKARIIVNQVFTEEILDDVEIDENGFIDAAVVKGYQANIQKELDAQMTLKGEISSARCIIDPQQNILSTNELKVEVRIIPKGLNKTITVTLGFLNPLNQ